MIARITAISLGVIPALVLLATLFSDAPGASSSSAFVVYVLGRVGIVVALHAAFGVAFGLVFPRSGWRWGLWLNVPTLFLLILFLPIFVINVAAGDADFGGTQELVETLLLLGFFAGSLGAACLGAGTGARARHRLSSE